MAHVGLVYFNRFYGGSRCLFLPDIALAAAGVYSKGYFGAWIPDPKKDPELRTQNKESLPPSLKLLRERQTLPPLTKSLPLSPIPYLHSILKSANGEPGCTA